MARTWIDKIPGEKILAQHVNDLQDNKLDKESFKAIFSPTATTPSTIDTATHDAFGITSYFPSGKYVIVYRQGTTHGGAGDYGIIRMRISVDQGKTWSAATTIASETNIDLRNVGGGVAPDGCLIVFYVQYDCDLGTFLSQHYIRSYDEGATWTDPIEISHGANITFSPYGGLIAIGDSRVLMSWYGDDGTDWTSYIVISSDNGKTWGNSIVVITSAAIEYTESSFIYVGGGEIIGLIREDNGTTLRQVKSIDNGVNWVDQGDTGFDSWHVGSGHPAWLSTFKAIDGQRIVAAYYANRSRALVRVSYGIAKDLIATGVSAWQCSMDIASIAGTDYAYPSVIHPFDQPYCLGWYYDGIVAGDADINFFTLEGDTRLTDKNIKGENFIKNSEFGSWAQSDANKGLATLAYDDGAKNAGIAPSVGDTCVGATSGATGKVISYTITGGAWADDDAEGVFTLGAVTGTFQDNETITLGGVETALVNGDKSIGITNDPCNNDDTVDWTQDGDSLIFDTNHYEFATSVANKVCYKTVSVKKGYIYKVEIEMKDGTAAPPTKIRLYFNDGVTQVGPDIDTGAGFVKYTETFKCVTTTAAGRAGITAVNPLGGNNIEIKKFSFYEITPCCTEADTLAFDGGQKDSTVDIYREHSNEETTTKRGGFYALKCVPSLDQDFIFFPKDNYTNEEWYKKFRGKSVIFGLWMKTSAPQHWRIATYDTQYNHSVYHPGDGEWHFLKVIRTVPSATVQLTIRLRFDGNPEIDGSTIAYISQPILMLGNSIDEGNYRPRQQEWVQCEKAIPFNTLNNKTGFTDIAWAKLNIERESEGMIPKGAKALLIGASVNDDGSAGADCYLVFRKDATLAEQLYFSPYGLANDAIHRGEGIINLDANGDLDYKIVATNGNFDIPRLKVYAIQVN